MNLTNAIKKLSLNKAYEYLDRDPENNIPKMLDLAEKLDQDGGIARQLGPVRQALSDPDNNWFQLAKSLWTDVDSEVRKTLFTNFVVNANMISNPKLTENREKYGCNIPWAILMDPTSACNLHCTGCWAAEYGNRMNMSFDELDSIIEQGKALGTYMYIYSGGEPLVRKDDLIALCNKHSDCQFLAFTNGTLIDEAFADEMLRVKNFVPAISVEGFEEDTDFRRGKETFEKLRRGTEILREKKLPFGVSCCYTSRNYKMIGSEEYFDAMVEWGAKFAWFFTYMPVGVGAPTDLMATAEQREFMYRRIREFRKTKPLFTMDFWNDGEYVQGCIAGGRCYLHINANGDIEPCAFIHYSDSNIREKTLIEAYRSPMFMAYHNNQPFNENHLRPCPLLDNPGRLTQMVESSGAHSTDLQDPEDVHDLTEKCREKAEKWAPVADHLWECSHGCASCVGCQKEGK
ncbi:radical SAM protein [Oscillibacter sp. MSJ-2]|uniref:Radical SAM protein n=1 Tax=Dysosmobacter acutus TaxID=2841504 RepID=A0ABS6F9G8_9FIRM|nr:radical SAM protein [Dysosmobacter acutus]MBU5626918.1 radical SAM protein [Dysosmobacter acutus]